MNDERLIEEEIEDSIFENLKTNLINEENLLLRLKSFYTEIYGFEHDELGMDDEYVNLERKTNKIASKILSNIVSDCNYKITSHKIYPFEYKLKFSILEDEAEEQSTFNLIISDDGFELLLLS